MMSDVNKSNVKQMVLDGACLDAWKDNYKKALQDLKRLLEVRLYNLSFTIFENFRQSYNYFVFIKNLILNIIIHGASLLTI